MPVIILSGYVDGDVRRRAREAGAAAVFEKPFSPAAFLRALDRVLAA